MSSTPNANDSPLRWVQVAVFAGAFAIGFGLTVAACGSTGSTPRTSPSTATGEEQLPGPPATQEPTSAAPPNATLTTSAAASATATAVATASAAPEPTSTPPPEAPISRELDARQGPIMWIHRTPACRKAGATGPGAGPFRIQKYPSQSTRLPLEVIYRIIMQNKRLILDCYGGSALADRCEDSRIWIRFAIGRDGRVFRSDPMKDRDGDPELSACIAKAMYHLSFPQPEGGIVTVTTPIRFLR